MRGSATLIGLIGGRSSARGQVHGSALPRIRPLADAADGLPPADGSASPTREAGLHHWMKVSPEQPQDIVWLVPQVGIDYDIETSTNLKWQIK